MLEKLLKDIKLQKEIKKIFAGNEGIIDIVLFGSVVRGKKYPQDIDLLLLFPRHVDDVVITKKGPEVLTNKCSTDLTTL